MSSSPDDRTLVTARFKHEETAQIVFETSPAHVPGTRLGTVAQWRCGREQVVEICEHVFDPRWKDHPFHFHVTRPGHQIKPTSD